uniref:C2H2-type domain-containing protein n=1 Tax=Trichobilharzia regenti TaxID=157069 RepID=A0AA85JVU1_TRIRE|nr:unnamed protein product [Trichobilharzia regenti]
MKSSKDSNGSLHLDSIPNKAVRENCGDKINKRNTVIGNMCHAVVSQKPTNEMKGKLSDNKNTSFSTTELSSLSSPPRTSECTHKPRRSLVDWDSFINLPKKQRNLSFRTGDPSRSVLTKTTPPALTSPVKLKQDYDKDCVLPVKTNDSTGKSPLTSPRSSSLQDKPCSPSSRSSYDKNPKRNAFAKKEDLPYAFKSDRISPPFVTKKPTESKKHRLSLFTADLTNCILLADGKDVKSQKGSHEQNHIYSSDSKKRKLSPSVFSCKMKKSSSILMKGSQCNGLLSTNSHPDKNRTRKKLYEINQFYESPSMFPATSSLVENVDDEISIRNGVISPGNYSLLNGHSGDDCKSPQYSYSKKSTVPASNDSKLKSVTPPWATRSTFSDDDSSIKIVNTTSDNTSPSQNKDLNSSKHHLSSKIHPSKLTEKDVWHNYRPPHNGPYTCSFCGQVIHKRSNFSKHLLTCKPRLSINDTEKMKSLSQKKKQKLHSLLKSCSKMSSKSDDVMKRLTRRILLHTAKNKKCDTSVNHVMENSSYETSDIFSSHDDTKDVSSCIESSHKSCLPTPIRSVCDTNEDFSDIFKDSTTPTTSKMKASRDLENERSVSEHKSNESLDEDNDSSVRTLRRTRVREMRTSTDKAKMIRRTSSKKLSKSETMCSPSSKVAEEQFDFTGSDTTSECSRAQISEDKPEDSNRKCDTSVNHVMENSSYETSDIFSSHDDTKDVSSCIESSHKSCLPTPIRSVCDTNEDFSDIFKDSTTPTTSKMKASRDLENERSVSEHKSNESLDEDNDSSVRTLRRTRVREMRTSTDKAKTIRRTSSKKLSKSETMCSPSSKVAEEQFDFTGSDTTSECSRAQISEDKPEDSNRKCDTSVNHVMENSSYETSDIFSSHDDTKDVSSCIESSHKSCLPTPIRSVCDTNEDFSDIFKDSTTPTTSKMKASRDLENERSVSEHKSNESLDEDNDSSVRTLRRTRVREMRTSTDKAKMIRRTSSKKLSKSETMCSPSSKVAEEQFDFTGSDTTSECSRAQISEDKPEDSNRKCDTSVNHVMENSSYETSDIFSSHDDTKDVSSCIESSHKSCLPTPIRSVCDTNEDFSDIFKMIRRTSSKKLSKSETMCSPSSKVAEEQFDFTGSDTTSECSRAQISEDKPEDSNRNKSDNSLFRSPNGLKTTDKEFSITKSSSLFKCDACSVEYSLQRLLSLHMRGKQHRLNVMKNELLMNESDKCDSEPVGNIIPDVVSNVCEKSVLVNPPVINNNEVVELPETSRHSITSEDDDDDNETLSKLSEKLKSSTIPNKNILNLETGKNSHWEFIESSRIESKDKTASFETDQQKHLSQTPKKSITVSSTSVFVCDTCSHPFRHRGSLLRHQRKTNHRNYNDSDKNPPSVPAIVPSTEILGQFCENNNMMEAISDLISEEYTDLVLTETTIVESNNNNDSNIILVKDVADSSHCESQNHKFPGLEISTINPFVSPQKGITTPMMNEKHPQSDTVVTPFFKREETVSKAYNAFNTDVIKEEETEYLLRASDTTPVDDVTAHSELTSTQSQNQSNETVQEKPVVDSENLSSMDDSTIPTEKPYSICLRRRSMSIQSNEGKKTSKRSSVKKTTGNSDSLPATPSTDEIVKSRRSSVSTLSSSDNFIDDAKSVISNATTIPASDEMNKDDPELSTVPSCPWCNKSGYSCLRILHIHQSRCPLRPKSIEEHKSPVPNKEIDKQVITNFICEECSRGFSSSTGLKVHCSMVKHKYTEQKPVPDDTFSQYIGCPGCSRDAPLFDSTEKLLKHLLTLKSGSGNNHTSRSQRWPTVLQVPNLGYGCHICGLLLASESRLDKHKKAVHEAWLLEEQQKISPGKLPQSCGNSS